MQGVELVAVDLPSLDVMRGRWAAVAAVTTALGFPDVARADGPSSWRWDDGGGNRAAMTVLDPARAVLHGWDRTGHSALTRGPDGEPGGELVADAPHWWLPPLRATTDEVSFVLGWDGTGWWRSPGVLPGGGLAGLPVDAEELYGVVDSYVEGVADDQGLGDWRTPWPSVAALGAAGPSLTVEQLADVLGPLRADLPAGVVAARMFGD